MMLRLKVIIVDDHEIFRSSLMMTLKRIFQESEFNEAADGKEFLEILKKTKIDLAIMDIKMPVMNGIEATRIAKKRYPDLKILGISMFGTYEDILDIQNAGASGFIRKGEDQDEIALAIDTIMNGGEYFTFYRVAN